MIEEVDIDGDGKIDYDGKILNNLIYPYKSILKVKTLNLTHLLKNSWLL